jgi:DNA-binding MarR family transcriptional regulator
MSATATGLRPEELAQNLFDVITQFCLAAPRGRRTLRGLKEIEFLTLSLLRRGPSLIVGDIQRSLGVLPAQMSRVIRSLEGREQPLIVCRINTRDKRKIDVALTPAGLQACQDYQDARLRHIGDLLTRLSEEDLEDLHRLLDKTQGLLQSPEARAR